MDDPGRYVREQVEQSGGSTRRKVSTVAGWFGVKRLTPAGRTRIEAALKAHNVSVEPSLMVAPKDSQVRLFHTPAKPTPAVAAAFAPVSRVPAGESVPVAGAAAPRPWWKRKRMAALVALLLLLLVGSLGDGGRDEPTTLASQTEEREQGGSPTETPTPTLTPTPTPAPTRADAVEEVDDNHYAAAMAAAALLGDDDERFIARRISRRLARRAMVALRSGNRRRAQSLLTTSDGYPSTPASRQAWTSLRAAKARAAAQARARRLAAAAAREAARQRRVVRVAAARQRRAAARQRRAAQRAAEEQALSAPSTPDVDSPSGPSSTNWCGKRDGDGDGIYCE